MVIALLIELHFVLAIRAYVKRVEAQQDMENNGYRQVYAVPYPPTYSAINTPDAKDDDREDDDGQAVYVAGQESVSNSKK
ncbi:hypothetical protein EC973_001013 [Apophysomyces ossiformis]|uniref:Uncharacterized protein n=1 Tax=Apophysomyces ossiformis TaxID=679940 RepID=A0A8H7C0A8_9FUNG|nr:hypothetical protein EC973_001013 [Apophysomyces ossiformis]